MVLDTEVTFSRVPHELFGLPATQVRLLTPIWGEELRAEAKAKLIDRKGLTDAAVRRWVGYLSEAFPGEHVELAVGGRTALSELTSDPRDEHVCSLAIAGRAAIILTRDRHYRPGPLAELGIRVLAPDAFLVGLMEDEAGAVLEVLQLQAATWAGGRPVTELLEAIERAGASDFAGRARAALAAGVGDLADVGHARDGRVPVSEQEGNLVHTFSREQCP